MLMDTHIVLHRYLMTGVSWWGHKVDNAYWVWSFQGRILRRCQMERFCQFLWRPRPPTLLAKKQIQKIKKDLKTKYSPGFEAEDVMYETTVRRHCYKFCLKRIFETCGKMCLSLLLGVQRED